MGSKHGKYGYLKIGEDLYAKIRILKNRDPKNPEAYYFTGVFVKKKPRKARIIEGSDIPEEILSKIRSLVSSLR
ncbi:MAG: DUF5622 domain-containing protein [Sulfolobales archaeon]